MSSTVPSPSTAHVLGRLQVIGVRVRKAVARRRAGNPEADDSFRGLYISDADVDALLSEEVARGPIAPPDKATGRFLVRLEDDADKAEAAGVDLRLRRLARAFELDPADVELLLVAMAPDIEPRFERLYGYLHDDVSRRRASAGLALELLGAELSGTERSRLGPSGRLCANRLLLVEDPERPFLTRSLRVPDRVTAHLLGSDEIDPMVESVLVRPVIADLGEVESLARALEAASSLVYLRESPGGAALSMAASALVALGALVLAIDLRRIGATEDLEELVGRASREARLLGAGIVAGPVEALVERGPGAVRILGECGAPLVIIGGQTWDPTVDPHDRPLPRCAAAHRPATGAHVGGGARRRGVGFRPGGGHSSVPAEPRAGSARPPRAARLLAGASGEALAAEHVQAAARGQNGAGLERLARRISPHMSWDDLVLPSSAIVQLREIVARIRHRDRVLREWGMASRSSKGHGVKVLFSGDSGTGKTISAEVIAHVLGLDLYVIDLVDGRRQVHRRDGEAPRPHLHRGRSGQRRAAVRRGRRHLREAIRREGRP